MTTTNKSLQDSETVISANDSPRNERAIKKAAQHIREKIFTAHPNVCAISQKEDAVEEATALVNQGVDFIRALSPQDQHEFVLSQQMAISQEWMSHCLMKAGQYINSDRLSTGEFGIKLANLGIKFMALYNQQMATLDRHRVAAKATAAPQSVHVNQGGQAIVGDVTIQQEQKE